MADAKRVATTGGTGLEGIASLLNMFGQTQKQSTTADTSGLTQLLAQLATPEDPAAQLASIFQQASGQIPKFQAAYGNAVGARSGGNSSVQAALDSLLQQTALAGQKQIADQTLQRQQIQANAAGNLANATRGVTQTTTPNLGLAGKTLGALQLLGQSGITDKLRKGILGTSAAAGGGDAAGSLFGAAMPNFAPSAGSNFFDAGSAESLGQNVGSFDFGNLTQDLSSDFLTSAADVASSAADTGSSFLDEAGSTLGDFWDDVTGFFGFADGGLVGRDGEKLQGKFQAKHYHPPGYADGGLVDGTQRRTGDPRTELALELAETGETMQERLARMNKLQKEKDAIKNSKAKNDYDKSSKMVDQATGIRFADGGIVKSPGGRRSSAPTFSAPAKATTAAINFTGNPAVGVAGPKRSEFGGEAGGFGGGSSGMGAVGGNSLMNFGVPSMGMGAAGTDEVGSGSTSTGIPNWAIGLLGTVLGVNPLVSFALKQGNNYLTAIDPTNVSGINATNGSDSMDNAAVAARQQHDQRMNQINQAIDIGAGSGPISGDAGGRDAVESAFDGLGESFSSEGFGGGSYGESSGGTGGGIVTSEDSAPRASMANGGEVEGPGTGTSDSIPARLSHGEYVIPADVVDAVGVDFFDHLRKQFHVLATVGGNK